MSDPWYVAADASVTDTWFQVSEVGDSTLIFVSLDASYPSCVEIASSTSVLVGGVLVGLFF